MAETPTARFVAVDETVGQNISGVEVLSDTQGVDFKPYIEGVLRDIRARWVPLLPKDAQPPTLKKGITLIRFKIAPDGTVSGMLLDASSHDVDMNKAAWFSIKNQHFAPLPSTFTGPFLEIRLTFRVNAKAKQ